MKKIKIGLLPLVIATLLTLQGCDKREQNILFPPGISKDLVEIAADEGLTVFVAALKASGIDKELDYLGQYTLLAPNDAAFSAAGITAANVSSLPPATLRAVLRNHMITGRIPSANILPGPNAIYSSIQRDILNTSTYGTSVFFNGKRVLKTNILANNGIIHIINGLLMPPAGNLTSTIAANPNLTFLAAAITRAGLTNALNNTNSLLTIFAPTNAAFQAAGFADLAAVNAADPATLQSILAYHVVPSTNISNGIIGSALNRQGRLFSCDFVNSQSYLTAQGTSLTAFVTSTGVAIKGTTNTVNANVTTADVVYYGSNVSTIRPGVLHIIDRVLLP